MIGRYSLIIGNVYVPADRNYRLSFLEELFNYLEKYGNQDSYLLGDFNFVENIKDRKGGFSKWEKLKRTKDMFGQT